MVPHEQIENNSNLRVVSWSRTALQKAASIPSLLMSDRRAWALFTAFCALIVYLVTLAPDLTWANYGGDGAELITASVTLGIPHPPGYPLYVLLGKIFSFIPLGTVAFRFNLLSAVSASIAAGFVSAAAAVILTARRQDESMSPAAPISIGLVFAFFPLVWGQALITEVYAVNMALVSALVWLLVQEKNSTRKSIITGLVFGLAVVSHLTSLLLLPLSLYLIPRNRWPGFAAGTALGLLLLLLLPIFGYSSSPVIWGQPGTLEGWFWLATARIYRPNVFSFPLTELPHRLQEWFAVHLWQPLVLGLPLIIVGWSGRSSREKKLQIALLATALMYAFYAFCYRTDDAIVSILPGLLLFSLSLTFGMKRLGIASLFLPIFLLALNFRGQNLGNDLAVRTSAESQMQKLPQGALVITPGDQTETTLLYLQHVEKIRTDLVIVDDTMFQFPWYRERLGVRFPFLERLGVDDVHGFRAANSGSRQLCDVGLIHSPIPECSTTVNPRLENHS